MKKWIEGQRYKQYAIWACTTPAFTIDYFTASPVHWELWQWSFTTYCICGPGSSTFFQFHFAGDSTDNTDNVWYRESLSSVKCITTSCTRDDTRGSPFSLRYELKGRCRSSAKCWKRTDQIPEERKSCWKANQVSPRVRSARHVIRYFGPVCPKILILWLTRTDINLDLNFTMYAWLLRLKMLWASWLQSCPECVCRFRGTKSRTASRVSDEFVLEDQASNRLQRSCMLRMNWRYCTTWSRIIRRSFYELPDVVVALLHAILLNALYKEDVLLAYLEGKLKSASMFTKCWSKSVDSVGHASSLSVCCCQSSRCPCLQESSSCWTWLGLQNQVSEEIFIMLFQIYSRFHGLQIRLKHLDRLRLLTQTQVRLGLIQSLIYYSLMNASIIIDKLIVPCLFVSYSCTSFHVGGSTPKGFQEFIATHILSKECCD